MVHPILVFTTSQDPNGICANYELHADADMTKPINLDEFSMVIARLSEFFAQIVALPTAR